MLRFVLPAAFMAAVFFSACSDDEKCHSCDSVPATTDAGTGTADSGGTGTSGTPLNGCTTYSDGAAIAWSLSSAPPATCLKVKKGGKVTFTGEFANHPLKGKGGDSGSPFATTTDTGASKEFTFDKVGTFGFVCGFHPEMTGAISVTE